MIDFVCINRVAFEIFGYQIYWYGILMCTAMIVAIFLASFYAKQKGIDSNLPFNLAIFVIPAGILCARLFACLFDNSLPLSDYFNFRTGGMSIIGALVGGLVALIIYFIIKKEKNIFVYFDVICSVLLLSQAIGRWGNFFNGELYGKLMEDSSSIFSKFPFTVEIKGQKYQALFFYEFVANLIGFAILSIIFFKEKRFGFVTAGYLIYYGAVRTILEPLRQEQFILRLGRLALSRLFSILMLASGLILLTILIINNQRDKHYDKK